MNLIELEQLINSAYDPDWYHYLEQEEVLGALETPPPMPFQKEYLPPRNVISSSPPGTGKTAFFSIILPTYLIYRDPMTHIILTANSDSLARLAAQEVLRRIQSPAFQEVCPLELTTATGTTFTVAGNDGRPTLHSAGIRGQLTGHRAQYLIFDDLLKSLSEAYSETVRETVWSAFNSAAETRLLPTGQIFGIHTRWHGADPIGRLLQRAKSNKFSRQFRYVNLAATNMNGESYIEDTTTGITPIGRYRSLATKPRQPYSFSEDDYRGKLADLGPRIYSPLYMGNPIDGEARMFAPETWGVVEAINTEEYL